MPDHSVTFIPYNKSVIVREGTSLLEAADKAGIRLGNLCGGHGICGRCRMKIVQGGAVMKATGKLAASEIAEGYLLACLTPVTGDLVVEIPPDTLAKTISGIDAERFKEFGQLSEGSIPHQFSPLVKKIYLELDTPTLESNDPDHQRLLNALKQKTGTSSAGIGLDLLKNLPSVLRENDFRLTITAGETFDGISIISIEPGNTTDTCYMAVVDIGTTTIVAHLVDAAGVNTIAAKACFNSQAIHGGEVTSRIIASEKKGIEELKVLLVNDINMLIEKLSGEIRIKTDDIKAIICAGNTVMSHFLLGLPAHNIRRTPYIPVSVESPILCAAETGIRIDPHGLLYLLPGISGWVGGDITAGILATRMHENDELSLLVDIGTNGEIVAGNKDWLMAVSASTGPALEGANVACGIRAETGAIEKVFIRNGKVAFETIGSASPAGICGSGIIDLLSVLFKANIINRQGRFTGNADENIITINNRKAYLLAHKEESLHGQPVYISESDIENVITAKAAVFAAIKILVSRLEISFDDIDRFYIAGAFGNHIDIENAVAIGLIPDISREKIVFAGNTSLKGAKQAAWYKDAYREISGIRQMTTYYDLMGAPDYVDEFRKAMFLPHTDIELFKNIQ